MIICTVISNSHISQLLTLNQSIESFYPDTKHLVCLIERDLSKVKKHSKIEWVLAKDLYEGDFELFQSKYSIYETAGACKPLILDYALKKFSNEKRFLYLDADTFLYSRLYEIERLINNSDIIVTPQIIYPSFKDELINTEINLLKTGIINTGIIACNRTKNTVRLIKWWKDRLHDFCFVDIPQGLYTDQKWFDFIPVYSDNFQILKEPGYNVAYWNLHEREIKYEINELYINDKPLRIFHFSSIKQLEKTFTSTNNLTGRYLLKEYQSKLNQNGYDYFSCLPWSYDKLKKEDNRNGPRSIRPSRQKKGNNSRGKRR